jgi:hypothetical protein
LAQPCTPNREGQPKNRNQINPAVMLPVERNLDQLVAIRPPAEILAMWSMVILSLSERGF